MFLLGNASLGRKRHIPVADWPEMLAAAVPLQQLWMGDAVRSQCRQHT